MRNLIIILDPAHGSNVKGKKSPDGTHLEYQWSRSICNQLADILITNNFKVVFTNQEEVEIGLSKRKEIANSINISRGETKLLISLHNNALGNSDYWYNARGYEIYTSKGNTKSDKMADIFMKNLQEDFPDFRARADHSDGDLDKESNFTVLMGNYSAVLIEWLFQDNKEDVKLLQDNETNLRFINSLVKSLIYIDEHLI